jgi:hypothetical protein
MTDIQALAAEYLRRAEQMGGCGDGGCVIFIRKGMHTNGGCRCARAINSDASRERQIGALLSAGQKLARAVMMKEKDEYIHPDYARRARRAALEKNDD